MHFIVYLSVLIKDVIVKEYGIQLRLTGDECLNINTKAYGI